MSAFVAVGTMCACVAAAVPAFVRQATTRTRAERLCIVSQADWDAAAGDGGIGSEALASGKHLELADELILVIVAAALKSGAALPRALAVVGRTVGGNSGAFLTRFDAALGIGYHWNEAMQGANCEIEPVLAALEPSWTSGVDPDAALWMLAEQLRRDRKSRAKIAAAKLAVRLVLPLGLCFLPAFVALGLFPLILGFSGL